MRPMKVLVGCEFSGVVRSAFRAAGHNAWSCDLLPAKDGGPHICGDVRDVIEWDWDLAIFHPPYRHTAVSGARWFRNKEEQQREAVEFASHLMRAGNIPMRCLVSPVSVLSTRIGRPHQIIKPWTVGSLDDKDVCLWLANLPSLQPVALTGADFIAMSRKQSSGDRSQDAYESLAAAMAAQWTGHYAAETQRYGLFFTNERGFQ